MRTLATKDLCSFCISTKGMDAMDYFQGTGFYARQQDPKTKPNIFDTRQSFLLKMHDDQMRTDFLNSFNYRYN